MKKYLVIIALLLFTSPAFSATQQAATELLMSSMETSLGTVSNTLQGVALRWLCLFMIFQLTWTNITKLITGADLEQVFAKFIGSLMWAGIALYVFEHGGPFISKVAAEFLQIGSGSGAVAFDPTSPLNKGIEVASSLLEQLDKSQGIFQSLNPFPSIMMGLVSVVILGTSALIAFKILMTFIETKIVVALSPISFALLGLDALREQGFAPLKYLISLVYRIMIYAAILITMTAFSAEIIKEFATLPSMSDPSVWPPIWAAALGYVLLFGVAWKADSIAAMLSSGSSQMSTGDAAAVGAVAGAAAAAAVSGGTSIASGAKSTGPIGNLLKSMSAGGGAAAKNESRGGIGGREIDSGPAPQAPAMSFAEIAANGSTPPKRSDFESPSSKAPSPSISHGNNPPHQRQDVSPTPSTSSAKGQSAGIGGTANTGTDNGNGGMASFGDHLKELNDHTQREGSAVHVSMNTHSEL
ncbi:MAG: type IV secretion system protein [Gallionella sp.]|nr:type IV secretion system protein [Gallionella sp.]